jgi:hypothetical protein
MNAKILATLGLFVLFVTTGLKPAANQISSTHSEELVLAGLDFGSGTLNGTVATLDGLVLANGEYGGSYTSPVLMAPIPFNAMVPQWIAEVPEAADIQLSVRTRAENGDWSQWYDVHEQPDWTLESDPDIVGEMVTVPEADETHYYLQFAVSLSRGLSQTTPNLRLLRLTFIDSTLGPTVEELVAQQEALPQEESGSLDGGYPKPPVVSRAVWCTDPACNYSSGLEYEPVTHLIVHHTVSNNNGSDWAATVRAIWSFHTFNRGWGDIGYNYLVDANGVLYEGHLGGDDVVGTHAAGANAGSMALSFIGTFTESYQNPPGITPPPAMLNSAAELFAWKADQKNIDVFSASHLPNLEWGLPHLMGHRDVYGTTVCPGDQAHKLLPWLRSEVANRIGFVSPHIYIDEQSSAFNKGGSAWFTPPGGCGFNGHSYYTWSTTDPGSSENWGEWRPNIPTSDTYEVEVYAPYCKTGRSETAGASYRITHAGGTDTIVTSHEANVGTWMSLGTYNFNAGTSGLIRLTDLVSTESGLGVWFDTIRLRPSDGPPPPPPAPDVTSLEPLNSSWLSQRDVTFDWAVSDPSNVTTTKLEIAEDASFDNIVLSETLAGAPTSYDYIFSQDFIHLYWRVKVTTSFGQSTTSTPTWFAIDTLDPSSSISNVFLIDDSNYIVAWNGSDENGSGVVAYNVDYIADGDVAWTAWLSEEPRTSKMFTPPGGQVPSAKAYWFRSQAIDATGNIETEHANGDANTDQAILLYRQLDFPLFFR